MKLQPKILSIFFSVAVLLGAPLLWMVKNTVHQVLLQDIGMRGTFEAVEIAEGPVQGFQNQSEQALLPLLQQAQANTGASYATALSPQGLVVAHTNVSEKGKTYTDPIILEKLAAETPTIHPSEMKGSPVLLVSAPVWAVPKGDASEEFLLGGNEAQLKKTRLGTVLLCLPLKEVLLTQYRLFRKITAIVLVVGIMGIVLMLIFLRYQLLPIKYLSEATARIRHGDYEVKVPVRSKDELGSLADDFNRMSKGLSETTVSKDYLENVLSHMIDPLVVMAMDGTLRMVNQATSDLLGYSKTELDGQPAHVLFMARDPLKVHAEQETLIMRGPVRNLELEFVKKSGEKIPVLFSSSVLKDHQGQSIGIIAVAKDVTERKRLENVIRQSDKMSAVGQLAAGVAHEINNPLGVILGFAQACLRRLPPGEALEMPLKSIEKEALRCKSLVQDLLTFSRVSKIEREPIELNKTVEGALSLVTARARTANVQVHRELAADLPRLLGNPNQIQQVIVNLANNAFDAMEQGGTLTVKTTSTIEGPLSWVCLTVTDTGAGIPPEVISRIFEPFFTTKPVGKGTGLGLSLIHEMVKKHSGTIEVKSQPGSTEFHIKFPVRLAHERAPYDSPKK